MPRPRRDGQPTRAARRQKLNELVVRNLKPEPQPYLVWDTLQRGLALKVQPSGMRYWKVIYHCRGRPRWYNIGGAVGLADARRMAARVMLDVAEGRDPAAERRAQRGAGTFEELAARYVEEHAKRHNKSWAQADKLVRRHLLPRWGKLQAAAVSRDDVEALTARIVAPILANQVLAAASAVFSWAVKRQIVQVNPCHGVERNPTRSRERVLSDSEVGMFWRALDDAHPAAAAALRMILITGQRPGEVSRMRREHVVDGRWQMPGEPVPALGWPGTKNAQSHGIWLSAPALEVMAAPGKFNGFSENPLNPPSGFAFATERGRPVSGEVLAAAMRAACAKLGVPRATPHDLRRTFSSRVTALGFGRDAMNRVTNHRDGGIASVYDRHGYAEENKRVMEAVAAHIVALVDGRPAANVVALMPRQTN